MRRALLLVVMLAGCQADQAIVGRPAAPTAAVSAASSPRLTDAQFEQLSLDLRHRSAERRLAAAYALGESGDERAAGPLIAVLLYNPPDEPGPFAQAIGRLGPAAVRQLIIALDDGTGLLCERADKILPCLGPEAVVPVAALMGHENDRLRKSATLALGLMRQNSAVPALIQAATTPGYGDSFAAVWSLRRLNDVAATDVLIAKLKDPYAPTRVEAACALGTLGQERAIEPLMAALANEHAWTRMAAAEALGKLKAKQALPQLRQLASQDPQPEVRQATGRAVAAIEQ